jgi:hypothetical protein
MASSISPCSGAPGNVMHKQIAPATWPTTFAGQSAGRLPRMAVPCQGVRLECVPLLQPAAAGFANAFF